MAFEPYPALAVLGPTGSGKSALALALALRFSGEIVNCDALQMYIGMDIGTAKPPASDRHIVPHHLLDVRQPDRPFSAGEYQALGRAALADIRSRNRLALVTGGTGFYYRALTQGLFEGPGRSEKWRVRLRGIVRRGGTSRLYHALARIDPVAAGRIAPADTDRILRSYEVYLSTGKPITWWRARPSPALSGFAWLKLGIAWPRPVLYARIDARVGAMFDAGLVAEVESLLRNYPRDSHAFKAIGYRQAAEYLEGRIGLEQAIEETRRESRRYAKRQLTWFRADPELHWLDADSGADLPAAAGALVEAFVAERRPGASRS